MNTICLFLFSCCLLCAVLEDIKYQSVKRVVWWVGGVLGWLLCCSNGNTGSSLILEVFLFGILQFGLFSRFYGKADCFAFVCCSLVLAAYGGGLREYLLHMLLAISLLGGVQILRDNINTRGNLKRPVAFIPYIAPAFYLVLFFLTGFI